MDRSDPGARVAEHHQSGTGTARIGYPIGIRTLQVRRKERLTSKMLRLVLAGPDIDGFHSYQADDHVMIVFPDADGTLRIPTATPELELNWPRPLPAGRKYTIRRFDRAAGEMDLDFVLHDGGLASTWAERVEIGADVVIAGPPGAKAFPYHHRQYIFAVDATALPAVARWLEEAPESSAVHVVVVTDEDIEHGYPLAQRAGVTVSWLTRDGNPMQLSAAVQRLELSTDDTFLFAAGEADEIKPLRAWSKGRLDSLVTGYWKRGVAGLDD